MKNKKVLIVGLFLLSFIVSFANKTADFEKRLARAKYPVELDFKGTPLSDALSNISKTTNLSIVASSEIANLPIDIYLPKGQTLKRVIDTLKNTNGLVSRVVNDTMILSKAKLTTETKEQIGRVIGKITEIDKITGVKGVTLSLGDNIDTLVLSDVGGAFIIDNVNPGIYILKASKRGYKPTSQIVEVSSGKAKMVELVLSKLKSEMTSGENIVKKEDLGKVVKDNGDIRDTKMIQIIYGELSEILKMVKEVVPLDNVVENKKQNKLLLIGSEDNLKTAEKLVEKLDVPIKQVEIKVEIIDMTKDLSADLGMKWTATAIDGNFEMVKEKTAASFSGADGLNLGLGFGSFTNKDALKVSLDMLSTTTDMEVTARPTIVTLNGEEASIKVVNEEIVGYEETEDENGNSSKAPLFKDAGITLNVKPIIKSDETILIELNSKVSKFITGGAYGGAAEKKSETKTKIRVKNGETIIIGGLTRIDKSKTVTKTPLLGDIPLLGVLFKKTGTLDTKREIYIKLTPTIIK